MESLLSLTSLSVHRFELNRFKHQSSFGEKDQHPNNETGFLEINTQDHVLSFYYLIAFMYLDAEVTIT